MEEERDAALQRATAAEAASQEAAELAAEAVERAEEAASSWLGSLLPTNMWSSTADETTSKSAEINATQPPAASGLIDANIGTRAGENNDLHLEEESLLGSRQRNGRSARAGRVAEQKPMFSCVVDSISSTANAMTDAMTSYTAADTETV